MFNFRSMKTSVIVYFIVLTISNNLFCQYKKDELLKVVKINFEQLNKVRKFPQIYAFKYFIPALLWKLPKRSLTWDTTLARLAQMKAEDMAAKNYFDHIDKNGKGMNTILWQAGYPLPEYDKKGFIYEKDPKANNVESISSNSESPDKFIKDLIKDKGEWSKGHRKHLLGIGRFDRQHTHVGIGIAWNPQSEYGYYCSVLIVHPVR